LKESGFESTQASSTKAQKQKAPNMSVSPELEALLKKNKAKYQGGQAKTFKFPEGRTKIRILTGKPGEVFWADSGVHWIKSSKDGKPVAVVGCRETVYEEECEICQAIDKALKSVVDPEEEELIKSWKARKSVLVNALIRSGEKASEDPVIVELTPTTFGNILSVAEERAGEGINIFDMAEGYDLVVERRGKGLDTEYTVMPSAKPSAVPKGAIAKMHDLKAFIEANYFKGEERKALSAIASMTGVSVAAVAGVTAPRLTSSVAAGADDDEFATLPPKKAAASAPAAKKEEVTELPEADIDELMKEIDDLG
jgi:hypothetical protein